MGLPVELDEVSKINLVNYALRQAERDNYWPEDAVVELESFCRNDVPGSKEEYKARFAGRVCRAVTSNGRLGLALITRCRDGYMSADTLRNNGVNVPKQ